MRVKRERPDSVVLERGIRRIFLASRHGWTAKVLVQLGSRGRGNRRAQLVKTYEEAKAIKTAWLAGGIPPKGAPRVAADDEVSATLDDVLRARVLDLEARGKSAAVPERIRVFLRKAWAQGAALPLSTVTPDQLREYRQRREDAGCRPNTIIRELREFRAALKQAIPGGFKVPTDVFPAESLSRVRTMDRAMYDKVFARLRKQSGPVLADMADLALLGVMRLSDVRLLQRTSVNLPVGLLELPTTKTGEPRAVPLCPKAMAIIKRALARHTESPWVFPNPQGKPYSRVHISRAWRRAARSVGLSGYTFHDLRHILPTQAANDGATPDILKAMGGWKSSKTVARYAQVLNPTLRRFLGPPK